MSTTQLDCSIGMSVAESVYGTAVAATKFFEFTDEDLDLDLTVTTGQGLRVGSRFHRSNRRVITKHRGGGSFTCEAVSKGMGALLKAAFGTSVATQRATTGVYQQNHTPATADYLASYTLQKGIPPLGGGTTLAHTFLGSVCTGIEFDCSNGDLLKIKPSWDSREVKTDVAYAAPSYPAEPVELFHFAGGAMILGGTVTEATTTALATGGTAAANIRDFSLSYENNLDDGGFNFGASGKRSRNPALGWGSITGKITAEFDAVTLRDAFVSQTGLDLVLTFTGAGTIGTGADKPGLQIHIPDIHLLGELPKANGGSVITQSISFEGTDDQTAAAPIRVSYVSTDTAP